MIDISVEEIMQNSWKYPGLALRDEGSLVLSLSINDSIRLWSSWFVFFTGTEFYVRRIEWPRTADSFPLKAAGPTTFGSESVLPKDVATSLVEQAHHLVTANMLLPKAGLLIDGVYCAIDLGVAEGRKGISWVNGSRQAPEVLERWLSEAVKNLNRHLPESTARLVHGTL